MPHPLRRLITLVERRSSYALAFLVSGVLLFGAAYSLYLGEDLRFLPDEQNYLALAQNMAAGKGYALPPQSWHISRCLDLHGGAPAPTAFRAPGYPLALAVPVWLGGGVTLLRMLNFLALAGVVALVYRTLHAHAGPLAAALGAAFTVGYPVYLFTAGTLYPQTLGGLLFLVALYLLTRARPALFAGGVVLGCLALTIPLFLFTLPVFILWLWSARQQPFLKTAALLTGAALLVVAPWTLRNYLAFNAFVPIATNSGFNLALGNSPHTTVNAETSLDPCDHWPEALQLGEIAQDAYFRAQALDFARSQPAQALKLYGQKLLNYFNYSNRLATETEGLPARDLLMLFTYGPLLALAVARRAPLRDVEWLFIALYLGSALVSAFFFTRIRFRLPFDSLLIMLAALSAARILEDKNEKDRPPTE